MAQQLHAAGQGVALVAMMDTDLPSDEVWTAIEAVQRRRKGQRLDGHWKQLARLPLAGKLEYATGMLRKKLRAVLPLSEGARREKRITRVEQLFMQTNFAYRPKPYPGKLTLILSQELLRRNCQEPWKRLAGEVETHAVPGDHVSRITTHAADSARVLRACLDQAVGAA
jgi:thioesterase domain-containing protein